MYHAIVVGSGFSGAVIARQLAEKYNKKVLIIEKRNHIGGNMYEAEDINGIRVQCYGPHIFHTNNKKVMDYLKRFSDFYPYEHEVLGKIDGQLVPIPFNYHSLDMLYPLEKAHSIKEKLSFHFPGQKETSIFELLNADDSEIRELGSYIYKNVFVNYTAKQWNLPVEQIDTSVINRVPVTLGYDNRYFKDKYQCMPIDGFTLLFVEMLNHPNITVKLNTDAAHLIQLDLSSKKIMVDGNLWDKALIYTGPIDELFNYEKGYLPYRSLDLVLEQYPLTQYQPKAVVNYPNEEEFTRITEFKHLTKQQLEGRTTILKEYPLQYNPMGKKGNIPYYPIINQENLSLYTSYNDEAEKFSNLYLCGRLAEYRYYNMDAVIDRALRLSEEIGEKL